MSRWTEKGLTPEERANELSIYLGITTINPARKAVAAAIRTACDEARAEERRALAVEIDDGLAEALPSIDEMEWGDGAEGRAEGLEQARAIVRKAIRDRSSEAKEGE